jgi:hypothetical protein
MASRSNGSRKEIPVRFTEAIVKPGVYAEVTAYIDKRIRQRRQGWCKDEYDAFRSTMLVGLLHRDPEWSDKWRGYVNRMLPSGLSDCHREKLSIPEDGEADLGMCEDGVTSVYDTACDVVSLDHYESATGEPEEPEPTTVGEWLNHAFKTLCLNFRPLNEDPANIAQGDPLAVLSLLDTAATAHLAKPEWVETWHRVWQYIRSKPELPSYPEIAKHCNCDKNTAKKIHERWRTVAANFQDRWARAWGDYTDQQKANWLHDTLDAITRGIVSDIEQLQRNLEREQRERKYGDKWMRMFPPKL